ncbi:glycolate oxidase subunit GlcF [Tepidamorphus sp. 3E244]|uniref:glycolate oxidase subunit GlcF n=1 Tax=Tepidamorphus sp. 3E244 TaxID=3385498 RepID=UPI0038FCD874
MKTNFTETQLENPDVAESEKILRTCVHCGFCTATCPTYLLLGDELDSPRGRIYLIKDMLENGKPANADVVKHIDRCLSCLSCMTTCPSGVHYMHLVDHARHHVEETYQRPWHDRAMRNLLAAVLPYPGRFRMSLLGAFYGKPLVPLLRAIPGMERFAAMLSLAPARLPARSSHEGAARFEAEGTRKSRVAILQGCAQPVLNPAINAATVRLLTRLGVEVVQAAGEGCCGALVHHMGKTDDALDFARANVDAWTAEIENGGLDSIIITASGCGTTIKDYGFMLRHDAAYAEKAARVSALAKDVTEYLETLELPAPSNPLNAVVAYHSACSMQHGQQIREAPKTLLRKTGLTVKDVPEGHICCGSAGTYNILQPKIAERLRDRKVANIERLQPDLIATGNIGCMAQIGSGTGIPIVHTVELIDHAHGGPMPEALAAAGIRLEIPAAAQ